MATTFNTTCFKTMQSILQKLNLSNARINKTKFVVSRNNGLLNNNNVRQSKIYFYVQSNFCCSVQYLASLINPFNK